MDYAKEGQMRFLQPKVDYLGHPIDAEWLWATKEKLEAILNLYEYTEASSSLGLLNSSSKFIPNLASLIHPFNV